MYKTKDFKEFEAQTVIAFMKENSFAMVTGIGNTYPVATQIPLEVEEKNGKIFLHGHLMKKTDHHLARSEERRVGKEC